MASCLWCEMRQRERKLPYFMLRLLIRGHHSAPCPWLEIMVGNGQNGIRAIDGLGSSPYLHTELGLICNTEAYYLSSTKILVSGCFKNLWTKFSSLFKNLSNDRIE